MHRGRRGRAAGGTAWVRRGRGVRSGTESRSGTQHAVRRAVRSAVGHGSAGAAASGRARSRSPGRGGSPRPIGREAADRLDRTASDAATASGKPAPPRAIAPSPAPGRPSMRAADHPPPASPTSPGNTPVACRTPASRVASRTIPLHHDAARRAAEQAPGPPPVPPTAPAVTRPTARAPSTATPPAPPHPSRGPHLLDRRAARTSSTAARPAPVTDKKSDLDNKSVR
jgi:hypothetical protein